LMLIGTVRQIGLRAGAYSLRLARGNTLCGYVMGLGGFDPGKDDGIAKLHDQINFPASPTPAFCQNLRPKSLIGLFRGQLCGMATVIRNSTLYFVTHCFATPVPVPFDIFHAWAGRWPAPPHRRHHERTFGPAPFVTAVLYPRG